MKRITAMVAAAALAAAPAMALAQPHAAPEPVKLDDRELDEVTGGEGSLLNLNADLKVLLENIAITVNLSNVPVNAGLVVQANALGQAIQSATVVAAQKVTQMQSLNTFP